MALAPDYLWWLLPVLAGLILSIPFVWTTARPDLGLAARRWGLFLTPEETAPPDELLHLTIEPQQPAEQRRGHQRLDHGPTGLGHPQAG
ncbi:MAG: hypothetical protein GY778_29375 [bacterium]|nr:hypothetical protein [bacterium]